MAAAYRFEYDAWNRIIAARFAANFTDDIFTEFYRSAPSFLESREVRAAIIDLGQVTSFEASPEVVRKIAALEPLLPDPIPRYVIAPPDHIFGTARMFQLLSGRKREALRVVRSEAEAYGALGVVNPQFERLVMS
jgi:hypothetical protein